MRELGSFVRSHMTAADKTTANEDHQRNAKQEHAEREE